MNSFMIQVLIEQVNTLAVLTLNCPLKVLLKTLGKPVDFRPSFLIPHSEVFLIHYYLLLIIVYIRCLLYYN